MNCKSRAFFFIRAGGGVALLYASKELDKLETANFDQKIGVQIIKNALKVSTSCSLYGCSPCICWAMMQNLEKISQPQRNELGA